MDFKLSGEHQAIKDMASDFSREHLAPFASMWDETSNFPIATMKAAAKLGMAAMICNEDIGGAGLKRLESAIVFEQLAKGCVATSAYLSIHNMVSVIVDQYADVRLRALWGPKLSQMDVLGSYCLTEPSSGSDAASLSTKAVVEGDDYVISGTKAFISGGSVSDLYLCMVRTGDETHKGISCVLVEKDRPGVSFGKLEHKMGWRNQPTSMVFFENCRIPRSNLIGKEGEGFKIALNALNGGRINIAACSLGGALACLQFSQKYMQERHQFGKPLSNIQSLRFYFADMLTKYEAARLMVYRAANAMDEQYPDAPMYCAMAKRLATDNAFAIADKAMQIHGGYGYLQDYQIERIFRDLRVHQILEGTNEIMREIIAKASLNSRYNID